MSFNNYNPATLLVITGNGQTSHLTDAGTCSIRDAIDRSEGRNYRATAVFLGDEWNRAAARLQTAEGWETAHGDRAAVIVHTTDGLMIVDCHGETWGRAALRALGVASAEGLGIRPKAVAAFTLPEWGVGGARLVNAFAHVIGSVAL